MVFPSPGFKNAVALFVEGLVLLGIRVKPVSKGELDDFASTRKFGIALADDVLDLLLLVGGD